MSYKDLLVHLDDTKANRKRLEAALALAERWGAHLTGLYCVGRYEARGYVQIPGEVVARRRQEEEEAARVRLSEFEEAAARAGVSATARTATVAMSDVAREVALHARYSDLAILGQPDPDEDYPNAGPIIEEVVFASGRPTLLIPYIGASTRNGAIELGRRVMVAWDAGREATRAVNDALPLLKAAEHVDLIAVNPIKGQRRHGDEPGSDIALHLARHGVKVEVHSLEARDMGAGDVILSRLSDEGSDLLVMGAYGHSRLRELVLGGVTRSVLQHMTVPVLMSH